MLHLDLFSGIGGFALATETVWPGTEHIFCEIDPFCQAILKKHWPNAKIYGDIKTLTYADYSRQLQSKGINQDERERTNDSFGILTGGFPCQCFSIAGKRKGTSDPRFLWPEMHRIIQEFSPRYVVAENVRGLLSIDGGMVFEQVCLDLEALGYEVQPFVIPACAVNAPHRRDRVWIVAHSNNFRQRGRGGEECGKQERVMVTNEQRRNEIRNQDERRDWSDWYEVATKLCTLDDGLSNGLVRPRGWRNASLKAAGNAIVPQVAEQILRSIKHTN